MFFNISGFSQNGKIATKYQNKNCGKTSTFQFLQHVVIQINKSMFCHSFCFDISLQFSHFAQNLKFQKTLAG